MLPFLRRAGQQSKNRHLNLHVLSIGNEENWLLVGRGRETVAGGRLETKPFHGTLSTVLIFKMFDA